MKEKKKERKKETKKERKKERMKRRKAVMFPIIIHCNRENKTIVI